jgi:DUF971 family protein
MLEIAWGDNHTSFHHLYVLRKFCPCAACQKDRDPAGGDVLLPVLQPGQNELREIRPVGNYALQFIWGDGHNTGIYTYEFLRKLCECGKCRNEAGK